MKKDRFFVDEFGRLWMRRCTNENGDYEDSIFEGYSNHTTPIEIWELRHSDSIDVADSRSVDLEDAEEINIVQAERIKQRFLEEINDD